ncbi:hypothetical protein, partial [Burkholderia sp. SIMBA_024]|uniref:hypothetical protein n=1 Tax=Burkholderia sp. SIMBA_024 TaxID=3085768 RepID=UPI0039796440
GRRFDGVRQFVGQDHICRSNRAYPTCTCDLDLQTAKDEYCTAVAAPISIHNALLPDCGTAGVSEARDMMDPAYLLARFGGVARGTTL